MYSTRFAPFFVTLLFVISCTSPSVLKEVDREVQATRQRTVKELSLLFSANRFLEMEPCGCELLHYGGGHREWNLRQKWIRPGSETLTLNMGVSFAPIPEDFDPEKFKGLRQEVSTKKAEFLVSMMNELGVSALGISVEDTMLGLKKVRELEKAAKFPFLSTNLYSKSTGKPLFSTSFQVNYPNLTVRVLSLSREGTGSYPVDSDVVVKSPLEALEAALAVKTAVPELVVVLSTLSADERFALWSLFPQVQVFVGGEGSDRNFAVEQVSSSRLFINPLRRGRSLARLDLDIRGPVSKFYEKALARKHSEDLRSVEKRLKGRLAKPDREALVARRAELKAMVLAPAPDTTSYVAEVEYLDGKYEQPENPIRRLISSAKSEVRDCGLRQLEGL